MHIKHLINALNKTAQAWLKYTYSKDVLVYIPIYLNNLGLQNVLSCDCGFLSRIEGITLYIIFLHYKTCIPFSDAYLMWLYDTVSDFDWKCFANFTVHSSINM